MKLLQVVLCVVVGILGWGAKKSTQASQNLHGNDLHNRILTNYREEPLVFKKTLFPAKPFDDAKDALILYNAMAGLGTNETAIIGILAHRSYEQRQRIAEAYKRLYNTDLDDDLDGDLSGYFGQAIIYLTYPYGMLMARELFIGHMFFSTDTDDIMEVLLSLSNEGIKMVNVYYYALFKHSIKDDYIDLPDSRAKLLIIGLLEAKRDETTTDNSTLVKSDAQTIISHNWKDVTDVITMFTTRSFQHLQRVFDEYKKKTRHDIDDAFNNLENGEFKNGVIAVVKRAKSRVGFLAYRLYHTLSPNSLIRIIVGRCEIDLADIVKEYNRIYVPKLADHLKNTIKGDDDFLKVLLTLVGKK